MNHSAKAWLIFLVSPIAALAQQPPDTVTSDSMANTAMGTNALRNVNLSEAACHNTAGGESALYSNTSGSYNTAVGFSSLYSSTTASNNTAAGYESMYSTSTGADNTASGYQALRANSTGSGNTATGFLALYANTTGANNTAVGNSALYGHANASGNFNTAVGYYALYSNTSGLDNAAQGAYALQNNVSGGHNEAFGHQALLNSNSGSFNIGIGYQSGYYLVSGSNDVYLASVGGAAAESNTIRIGLTKATSLQAAHTATYVAGIYGTNVSGGAAVYVTASGQLVTQGSSERFKRDVETMADQGQRLGQLRPVTFRYRNDSSGTLQYGLIAEEVAKVYPELVIRGTDGQINGVRYEELAPLLLNQLNRQQARIAAQETRLAEMADLKQQVAELQKQNESMQAAILQLRAGDSLVANRQ